MPYKFILLTFISFLYISCNSSLQNMAGKSCMAAPPNSTIEYLFDSKKVKLDVYDLREANEKGVNDLYSSTKELGSDLYRNICRKIDLNISHDENVMSIVLFTHNPKSAEPKLYKEMTDGLILYYVDHEVLRSKMYVHDHTKWNEIMAVSKRKSDHSTNEFYSAGKYLQRSGHAITETIHLPIKSIDYKESNTTFEYVLNRL